MKVSKKKILLEASEVKLFVEKNKKLPTYATIDNSKFNPSQYCYLFAKQVSDINIQGIDKIVVKEPSKSVGDKINNKIVKNQYIDMAKRVAKYIETNKQAPNYVTIKNLRVSYELYTFCFSKILAYYNKNKVLPNYCLFNSSDIQSTATSTTKSKKTTNSSTSKNKKTTTLFVSAPHYTSSGCNKLGQCTKYYCAPHSIHQAIRKFGITKYSEKQIASWAGTTSNGTGHPGINTAIAKISKDSGVKLSVKWKNFSDMGSTDVERFKAIGKLLSDKNTAIFWHILYKSSNSTNGQGYGHYEYVDKINTSTKYVRALNSLGNKKSDGSFYGKLQDRQYNTQAYFARNTPGNQSALCIIKKG